MLDLKILAGDEYQIAVLVKAADISGPVDELRPGFVQRILYKGGGCPLRIVDVAQRNRRSANADFSLFAGGGQGVVVL